MPLQPPGGSPSPHCLAYLPSLSQPSVLMLYRAAEGRKRRREEEEQQEEEAKRKGGPDGGRSSGRSRFARPPRGRQRRRRSVTLPLRAQQRRYTHTHSPRRHTHTPAEPRVPDAVSPPGLNSLNFLLSAGQPVPGVGLPPSGVPALALPCVLVASPALSHFSLLSGGPAVPAMMPPGHFLMGAAPYGGGGCSSPERRRAYGSGLLVDRSIFPGPRSVLKSRRAGRRRRRRGAFRYLNIGVL
uniref:Uncharacterized protein n=1 Tax=Salarias fasciatus TaxID=181472 RepID=A0A672GAB0_SALFA